MDLTNEKTLIQSINDNLYFVKNTGIDHADKCAGQIRSTLESAVKLFWLKKYDKIPVWVKFGVARFDLQNAIDDERFSKHFNQLTLSDMHTLRKICNSVIHGGDSLTLDDAQELLSRLERCVKAIECAIPMTILTLIDKESNITVVVNSVKDIVAEPNEYSEPSFKYIIIKTTEKRLYEKNGNLYEATRWAWRASITRVSKYKYVFSVINGIVQDVFVAKNWQEVVDDDPKVDGRVEFFGTSASKELSSQFINKRIPAKYRKKGMASPLLYSKN